MSAAVSSDVGAAEVEGIVPPHDDAAEKVVLSAVMLDPSALPKIQDFLRHDMFFSEAHRRIFEAATEVRRAKDPVDITTVHGWLHARGTKRENRLMQVGGAGYLSEILDASPMVSNVRAHAVLVHDMWRRREIIKACQTVVANGYVGPGDVQAWCDAAVRTLGTLGMQNPVRPVETNEQTLARILADACMEPGDIDTTGPTTPMTGYPTGLFGIDRILGGVRKGGKTTIAATTGVGKTAIAIQVAVKLAKDGVGVFFLSTELKRMELLRRAVACEAGLDATRIRDRKLTPSEKVRLAEATTRLENLPLRIDETARITIEEVAGATKAMAEEMPYRHGVSLGVVVVDYIQRLEPSRHLQHKEKHEQVGHATRSLKILAQDLDLAVIELAQAKDPPAGKRPEKPKASNGISDSSQVAKESDDVIFLWADEDPKLNPRQSVLAIIAKQRSGAKGEVPLMFQRDQYRFEDANTPDLMASPSRQYLDRLPEPPQGRFDDYDHDGGGLP